MYVPNLGTTFTHDDEDADHTYTVTDTPGFGASENDTVELTRDDGEISTHYVDHFSGRSRWSKVSDAPDRHSDACECEDDALIQWDAKWSEGECDCGEDDAHRHCQRCGGVY